MVHIVLELQVRHHQVGLLSRFVGRNDMDTVGVRAGCTLTAYSDSSFNGDRIDIRAETYDRWVVFADHAEYRHMDSDIESLRCVCKY